MRRFGVEIEFSGIQHTRTHLVALTREAGIICQNLNRYSGFSANAWQIKTDSSVSSGTSAGGELVSPPMFYDEANLEQVDKVLECMQKAGAQPHDSAGVHIHVECRDLRVEHLQNLLIFFYKFEDVLYRIASSGWTSMRSMWRRFAKPLTHQQLQELLSATDVDSLLRYWSSVGKYTGINIMPIQRYGTVEFRLFNSTVNPKRMRAYIAICVAMVEDAMNKRRRINPQYKIGDMLNGERKQHASLHRFIQVMRYEAGMSPESVKLVRYCWKDSKPQGERVFTPQEAEESPIWVNYDIQRGADV